MKIGFLITARLKSSRLPLKVLKDLNGRTVIERIIDRAKRVHTVSEIVLCTSTNPQDKPLVDIAKENNIYYFNGSEDDVLQRLLDAALFFNLDYFVGITADNPLFSIDYTSRIVDELVRNNYDYVKLEGLPLGSATYGLKVKALQTICQVKNIINTEIWGRLIDRPELFDVYTIKVDKDLYRPEFRLTLDYIEDYVLLNHLYSRIEFCEVLNLYNVIQYLDRHPEVAKINAECIQLDLDPDMINRIEENFKNNIEQIKEIKKKIYNN